MKKCSNCESIINNTAIYCENCEQQLKTITNEKEQNLSEDTDKPLAYGLPSWDIVPPESQVVRRKRKI